MLHFLSLVESDYSVFISAVSSFAAVLIPDFFDVAQHIRSPPLSVDFSFDLSVSFSRYISRLSTSRQQFHNHHGGEISGFRSSFPSFLFPFTRYRLVSWRAAIRAHDEWLFRRASSSIVNVFLFLHPSMPTVLPSIIISFHLSGSSLSLDVALSSPPPFLSPDTPRDLPSSFLLPPPSTLHPPLPARPPRSFSSPLPALVRSRSRNFSTGSPRLVPLSSCPRYFLQFASYSSVPARHHHRPLRPSIDIWGQASWARRPASPVRFLNAGKPQHGSS